MKSSLRQTATPQHRSRPRGNDRAHPKTPSSGQYPRRRILSLAAGAAALPVVSRIAWPQAYPTRPVRLIVSPVRATRYVAEVVNSSVNRMAGFV